MKKVKSIGELIDILKWRLSQRWMYRTKPDSGYVSLEWEYEDLQRRAYDPKRIAETFDAAKRTLQYSDMAVLGVGDQPALAKRWGLKLPADYVAFCSEFKEYILATRKPVCLDRAKVVKEMTEALREGWNVPLANKHRLFQFARVVGNPSFYVFRWSVEMKRMDVCFVEDYGWSGEPTLLGEDGDSYVTDKDFTSWLARMIDTDGYPLEPGRREPDNASLTRIK